MSGDIKSVSWALSADEEPAAAEMPASYYRLDHHPEYLNLLSRLVVAQNCAPYFRLHQGLARDKTVIGDREYISFSNYNYVGLSGHPAVMAAAIAAAERYGTSVSASRLVGGERPIHLELETALAKFYDVEDCAVFVSGHSTNVTTIGHLFGPKDLVLYDASAHNSIMMGARLSGARCAAFRHNDLKMVDNLLRRYRHRYERVLVVIEGLYSMEGDFPDLPRFVELRNRHKIFLMVDEAHSFGVMGRCGRGLREHFGLSGSDVDIWMGTLSKALSSCGGYIAGCRALVTNLKFTAPGFMFSVGLSPFNAAAALAALQVVRAEPERVAQLRQRGRLFFDLAREHNLPMGSCQGLSIIPLIVGNSNKCFELANALFQRGIEVSPIVYPGVHERGARLRFFINCTHTEEQIRQAVGIIVDEWQRIGNHVG